jgi:hypothetical protein
VTAVLHPILTRLGFAAGQAGASGERGQLIFCRGSIDSADGGCVDLVVDLEALMSVEVRLRAMRVEFDRLDDSIDPLPRGLRAALVRWPLALRATLDQLDEAVTQLGAGL